MAGGAVAKIEVGQRWRLVQTLRRMILDVEVHAQLRQPAAVSPSDLAHHFPRLVGGHAANDGDAALDNARLFFGDGRQGLAQLLDVVEADAGNQRDGRRADVGRIEPAAEPHFQDGHIDPPVSKWHNAAAVMISK